MRYMVLMGLLACGSDATKTDGGTTLGIDAPDQACGSNGTVANGTEYTCTFNGYPGLCVADQLGVVHCYQQCTAAGACRIGAEQCTGLVTEQGPTSFCR